MSASRQAKRVLVILRRILPLESQWTNVTLWLESTLEAVDVWWNLMYRFSGHGSVSLKLSVRERSSTVRGSSQPILDNLVSTFLLLDESENSILVLKVNRVVDSCVVPNVSHVFIKSVLNGSFSMDIVQTGRSR